MMKLKIINGMLAIFISLPIWFYLLYRILDAIQASELMWFLYWLYVPISIFISFIAKVIEDD